MLAEAFTTHLNFMAVMPYYQQLLDDPTLRNDPEAARRFIDPVDQQAFGSFQRFLDVSSQFANDGRGFGATAIDMMTWLANEADLDDQQVQLIDREVREMRNTLADMNQGIDAYLDIDTGPVLASMPTLVRELQNAGEDVIARARARLRFIETWMPAMERYVSADAMIFASTAIGAFRRLGRLMEPIVYQVR